MRAVVRLAGGLALFSCSGAPPVLVERSTDVEYPAKRSPFEVAVLREPPAGPVVEIARLSATGGYHQTTDQVLARVREHAALLGADAIVLLRETYLLDTLLREGRYRGELYGLPGPPSAISEGPEPGLLRRPEVEARAFRYAPP